MAFLRGQSAIEFLVLITGIMAFFIFLLYAVYSNIEQETKEQLDIEVNEIARIIQDEINLAAGASDGYKRYFNLPERTANREYNTSIVGNSVFVRTYDGKFAVSLPVLNVSGDLKLGENLIRRYNGTIYLNE